MGDLLTSQTEEPQEVMDFNIDPNNPIPKENDVIFDLYHANRTIINDYGTSNPYPTCDAINIVRNSNELERFIKWN